MLVKAKSLDLARIRDNSVQALNNIIDISEIPLHLAVVENSKWLIVQYCFGEQE